VAAKPGLRLDIQGMRAFALIIILVYHARVPIGGGFIALDVFFVISGFVIAQMLMRERERTGRIDIRAFYVRRFRRLTPALATTVAVVVLVSVVLESPFGAQQITAATAVGAMLLSANVVIAATTGDYFDAAAELNPLLNIWSLSTEEQFYLVFPSIMVAAWLLARRRGWSPRAGLLLVVGSLAAASFALAVLTSGPDLEWPATAVLGYYGAVGRAWEFAAGALLAMVAAEVSRMPRWTAELLAWSGVLAIGAGIVLLTESVPYPSWATLIPVYGSAAMIAGGCAAATTVSRIMSTRPMVFVGDMSYSWYLWHWPLIVFAVALWPSRPFLAPAAAVVVSFVPAYLSYRFIELPIRFRRDPSARSTAWLAVASFGIPVVLAVALAAGARSTWWMDWPRGYTYQDSASYARGCHDTEPGLPECRWEPGAGKASGTVLLLGDSQAMSLSDGLIAANDGLGLATEVSSYSQCPFTAAGRIAFDYSNDGCDDWQAAALEYALDSRPDLVVIANRPYVDGMTGGTTLVDADGRVPATTEESVTAWIDALEGVVQPLREAGIPVLLVEPVPEASYDMPPTGMLHLGRARSTLAEALEARQVPLAADQQIVQRNPGVSLFDPVPLLCDDRVCPDVVDGDFLYADPRHLSVAGSLRLAPDLARAVGDSVTG
jgi:peptidoglycan/LPS O-acetylase OafA/YrhL